MKDFLLIFINVLFTVVGHMLLKHGMNQVGRVDSISMLPSIALRAIGNPFVIIGICTFVMTSGLWLVVLSRVKLSLAYPMLSMSYILAIIFSWLLFKEHIPYIRIMGAFVICIGVILVSVVVLRVTGTVTTSDGLPVPVATVTIINPAKGKIERVTTDADGKYQFAFWELLGLGTTQGDTLELRVEKNGTQLATVNHQITAEELNKSSITLGIELAE